MRRGEIVGINGNMVVAEFSDYVVQNEVAYIVHGEERLKGEVIRVRGNRAELQVYEDTKGLRVGEKVEFTDELLSVELGPGLLGQIFDGLQNPLPQLAKECGFFLKRGVYIEALPDKVKWEFTPSAKKGDRVKSGSKLGSVKEGIFDHWIMVPFGLSGDLEVESIVAKGKYDLKYVIAMLKDEQGRIHEAMMQQPAGDVDGPTVARELQRGYEIKGRVLRPARVVVAVPTEGDEEPAEDGNEDE